MSTETKDKEEWDDKAMMLKYIKFTHGCLIIDCVENELRAEAKVSDLLSFYGLYRQVMSGDNYTAQPSYIFAEKRLKWNAWTKYKGLTKQQALIKWEELYNKFLNQYPKVFAAYDNAYLDKYHPLTPFIDDTDNDNDDNKDMIDELQLEIKGVQFQLQQQPQPTAIDNDNNKNGDEYIKVKKQQYQEIIEYVNQLKHKMQKYHNEFDKNSKQIKMLKTSNNDLQSLINKMKMQNQHKIAENKNPSLKFYSFILCALFFIVVAWKYYKKRRKL